MAWELVETVTASSSVASLTFSGIPTDGKMLKIIANPQTNTNGVRLVIKVNGSTSGYNSKQLYYTGDIGQSSGLSSQWEAGLMSGSRGSCGSLDVILPNYANSEPKQFICKSFAAEGFGFAADLMLAYGNWNNSSAITSIELRPEVNVITTGATFSLYKFA